MHLSSNPENKKLDEHLATLKKRQAPKTTKLIGVTVTNFEYAQVEVLVEKGLASSVSALTKKALIKFIWENEKLIPEKLIPPKKKQGWKDKHQKKKREG